MKVSKWEDYTIVDAGNGEKFESWNGILLRRPDPLAMWDRELSDWKCDAVYHRNTEGGGSWQYNNRIVENWEVNYKELKFKISPTNFKHTGLFPEQAVNWDYMMKKIREADRPIRVLNLFAYTGGATVACSCAGASVVHVDSSKGMVSWAKENATLSKVGNNDIRYIVDDCLKFVLREERRGNKYDAIIMDPPSFGRGSKGEVWKFEDNINELVKACANILSDNPLFFTINTYTTGASSTALRNILTKAILNKYNTGSIDIDEVGLNIESSKLVMPCGMYARWENC